MGKKSRSKKGRSSQAKQVQRQQSQPIKSATPASLSGDTVPAAAVVRPAVSSKATVMDIQNDYIRGDILRILLLLVVVSILIVIAFLVGEKTSYLQEAGHKLSSFLKLQ